MKNPKGLSKALSAVGSVSFPRQFAFLEDYFAVLALNHSTNCSIVGRFLIDILNICKLLTKFRKKN